MEVPVSADTSGTNTQGTTETTAETVTTTSVADQTGITTNTPAEGAQAPAAPAWAPSYKFKVKDEEKEFDEFIRPVIKDAELEKKVKELYEKAHGLDEVKVSRENFKTKYEDVNTKFTNVEKSLQTLAGLTAKGDYGRFFDALQIPKEKVVKWVIDELKYNELPPEQKSQIDMQRSLEMEREMFEQRQSSVSQQMVELGRQQLEFEISKPEVSQFAQMFDQRLGRQGAFQQEVINRGAFYEQVHGKTLPASQLVSEVLQFLSPGQGQQSQPQSTALGQGGQQQAIVQQQKPAIPVFQGASNSSPVKAQVNSIADLRKLRQQNTQTT